MNKSNYATKLLDPRWQKKRLEILHRDNFKCRECGTTDETLYVHHKNYIYGEDPWSYTDENYITFCSDCHEIEHVYKEELNGLIHDLLLMGNTYKGLYNFFHSASGPICNTEFKDPVKLGIQNENH